MSIMRLPRKWQVALRYGSAALASTIVDNIAFYLFFTGLGWIFLAQTLARTIAVLFNYAVVRKIVFSSDERHGILLPRYLLLVVANLIVSYAGIRILAGASRAAVIPAKIVVETALFGANFLIQRAFVFVRSSKSVN
jgi:putative flippase GtrA